MFEINVCNFHAHDIDYILSSSYMNMPLFQAPSYRLDRVPEDEWIVPEDYYEDYVSEEENEDYSTKPVPIWLSVCLVIAYIVGGAFIFQVSLAL